MELTYVGPHRGGLQQVGSLPINIAWNVLVEIPDELAERLLEQSPDQWDATDPSFACPGCDKTYKTAEGRDRHVDDKHPDALTDPPTEADASSVVEPEEGTPS